jgi:predicted DNA-binding protein with PD1-like motif
MLSAACPKTRPGLSSGLRGALLPTLLVLSAQCLRGVTPRGGLTRRSSRQHVFMATGGDAAERQGLSTCAPARLSAHVVRLLPGDDLLLSLRAFAAERGLRAACVLSCVGSTSTTRLRPAGSSDAREFRGKFEIVSLVGTIANDAHHLHMAVADETCAMIGGHLVEGCIVRTTAEIVVGELEDVGFAREHDPRTGFKELFVTGPSAPLSPPHDG